MKIMIVDDEEVIRLGLEKIMSRMDLDIEVVGSFSTGSDALTYLLSLREGGLDALITDIKMPVMDGLKLIERTRERFPALPVIVLSGFGEFEYARAAIRYGVMDYLLKPVDKMQLFEVLKAVRSGAGPSAQPADRAGGEEGDHYVVDAIKSALDKDYNKSFELERLAETVGMSASYISRLFKSRTGLTITDYLIQLRMEKAKLFLTDHPNLKNYEISQLVGYGDPVYFNKLFKKTVGMTPKDFKLIAKK